MAKGNAMGLWTGKKGSTVFYRVTNSSDAQKQGMRERVYTPSNPQSYNQAGQRMKLLPAQRVYGILKDTIERSWQGVTYGAKTRYQYLKLALAQDVFPAVEKNSGIVVPGPYVIAQGSLQEYPQQFDENGVFVISMPGTSSVAYEEGTVADLATSILEQNPQLKAGDQLTFVLCYTTTNNSTNFIWVVRSIYLDTASTQPLNAVLGTGFELGSTQQSVTIQKAGGGMLYAAAMIISRDATTPLRSNARLIVRIDLLNEFYSASSKEAARESYMKRVYTRSTDWQVDPSTQEVAGATLSTYTIAGLTGTVNSLFNGAVVQVYRKDTDNSLVAVPVLMGEGVNGDGTIETGPCLVGENGQLLEREQTVEMEVITYNLLAAVVPDLASLRQVPFTPGA